MQLRINTKTIKITELKPNAWNPKLKPEDDLDVLQQYEEVIKSLKTYGLVDPILVRSGSPGKPFGYYEIINGYHRFLGCQELKYKDVIVNDLGEIDDQQAKKLTIVTEEIKIPVDQVKLSALLKEMMLSEDLDILSEGLPYSKELIQSKIELLDYDWSDEEGAMGEPTGGNMPSHTEAGENTLFLVFKDEKEKAVVENLFNLIKSEQKKSTISDSLVSFAQSYGKDK